jgi:hypothetical protein
MEAYGRAEVDEEIHRQNRNRNLINKKVKNILDSQVMQRLVATSI